jgi:CheY-like chemotaxis protein
VVITDLLMPERDGLEFITEVRKKHPAREDHRDVRAAGTSRGIPT